MKNLTAADQRRAVIGAFTESVVAIVERAILAEVQRFLGASTSSFAPSTRGHAPRAPAPRGPAPRRPVSAKRATPVARTPVARTPVARTYAAPTTVTPALRAPSPERLEKAPRPAAKPARSDAAEVERRILEIVQRRPGIAGEEARLDLGLPTLDWRAGIARLSLSNRVRKEADGRSTRFFAVGAVEPFKAVPPIRRKAREATGG